MTETLPTVLSTYLACVLALEAHVQQPVHSSPTPGTEGYALVQADATKLLNGRRVCRVCVIVLLARSGRATFVSLFLTVSLVVCCCSAQSVYLLLSHSLLVFSLRVPIATQVRCKAEALRKLCAIETTVQKYKEKMRSNKLTEEREKCTKGLELTAFVEPPQPPSTPGSSSRART